MKTHSISKSSKKLMAILCAVMMLASCMVFAPASAATACSCGFENADTFMNGKWNGRYTNYTSSAQGQRWKNVNCSVVEVDETQGKAMRMAFEESSNTRDDEDGADPKVGKYAGFRLFNDGAGAVNFTSGKTYAVSFKYKVESAATDLTLRVLGGSVNWNGANVVNAGDNQVAATIAAGTTTDWTQAYVFVKPNATGIHLTVQAADETAADGSVVYVDDISVDDPISYTMDVNYGSSSTSTVSALAGWPIAAVVSDPTRAGGYTFLGWFDAPEGGNQVTEFPAESTTLYAHWDTPEVPLYTVTFDGKGGTVVGDKSAEYAADETITQTAKRPGYSFLGWKNAAGETVTAAPADDVALYADWEKTGTVAAIDGLQDFEASANLAMKRFTWVEGEENHTFAGNGALKVAVGSSFSQRSRPRLILQSNGQDLIVEPGKSYTVSFWMRTVKSVSNAGYYLATMADNSRDGDIQKEAANQASNGKSDVHKLQTLTSTSVGALYNGATKSTNGKGTEVGDMGLAAGVWTQVTATFTAEAQVDGVPSYLALGLVSEKNGGVKGCDFYLDDIQVAETDTLAATHNYEAKPLGSYGANHGAANQLAGTGNGRTVTNEVMNHSFGLGGVGHTAKVKLEGQAINEPRNCYTALYNADATILQIKPGSSYLVSAWIYSATDATVGVYLRTANNAATWLGSPSVEVAKKTVDLQANTWTQVHLQGTIPTDGDYNVIALGFANTVADATKAVYVDDTSVLCADSALGKVNGNVGVYKNGENSYYEQDGVKYGALRLLGGYTIADGDATKAVIGGNTYTVKARGILLGKDEQTTLTVDGECYYKSEKTTNLDGYWLMEGNVLKYSLLVNKISADKIGTNVHYRPYIIVTDGTAEYTLYGDTVLNVNWSAVAESAGVDTGWTAE